MKLEYKNHIIEVEDEESRYFSSFYRGTEEEAIKDAKEEMKKEPILNRYRIIKHTFEPTEAYPEGINFEVIFFYNRPIEQYFDYGADIKGAMEYINNFIKKGIKPVYSYAVSSVERNMFLCCLNSALRITKFKDADKVLEQADKCLEITPYTNWSGD